MSHFTVVKTRITDEDALVAGLADLGFGAVERHAIAQPLVGFQGDQRAEIGHVIVRREHVGHLSNDIGFRRQADGTYQAIISEYDRSHAYSQGWVDRLTQRYAYHVVCARMQAQGYQVVQEATRADGQLQLTLQRWN